jgi:phage/plasmid-associated DNA primase
VGEIDDHRPLGVSFKNVIGRDLLHARHVTQRTFSFTNEACHVFNANGFPPTEDHTNAFFERWSIVRFDHVCPAQSRDPRLAEKIVGRELGAVLSWALDGARDLFACDERFIETTVHLDVLDQWRGRTDSVRSFFLDREAVELRMNWRDEHPGEADPGDEYFAHAQSELHREYRRWCERVGRKGFGLHAFGDSMRRAFERFGLSEDTKTHRIVGAHPKPREPLV